MCLNIVNDLKYFVEKEEESKFYVNNNDTDNMRENTVFHVPFPKVVRQHFWQLHFPLSAAHHPQINK